MGSGICKRRPRSRRCWHIKMPSSNVKRLSACIKSRISSSSFSRFASCRNSENTTTTRHKNNSAVLTIYLTLCLEITRKTLSTKATIAPARQRQPASTIRAQGWIHDPPHHPAAYRAAFGLARWSLACPRARHRHRFLLSRFLYPVKIA